jgi:hypothetical protein
MPTDFCAESRVGFSPGWEDRYTFHATAARPSDGKLTERCPASSFSVTIAPMTVAAPSPTRPATTRRISGFHAAFCFRALLDGVTLSAF